MHDGKTGNRNANGDCQILARRFEDLKRFYSLLDVLEQCNASAHTLSNCSGKMNWPQRGVYFFRETAEKRTDTGNGLRVVRVGTHSITSGSKATLWKRLKTHKGNTATGGGDHRRSIFRLLVGTALINRQNLKLPSWGVGSTADPATRRTETFLEIEVSKILGNMSFLWIVVEDDPGPNSMRAYIERNSIALLSNLSKTAIDSPSANWLGRHCAKQMVCQSGLWNQRHTDETYDPAFLRELEQLIAGMCHA